MYDCYTYIAHNDLIQWKHFRVTGLLCGEFTGHQWIPLRKASDAEARCFLWSALWINVWVNNREAGDLRRHCAHYGVIVMQVGSHQWFHMKRYWIRHYHIKALSTIFLISGKSTLHSWQSNKMTRNIRHMTRSNDRYMYNRMVCY